MQMSFEENTLTDVWRRIGAAKFFLGRRQIRLLTEACVKQWPHDRFQQSVTGEYRQIVCESLSQNVARQEYGSILSMFLISLVSAVVQVLLEWWLNEEYRVPFAAWTLRLRDSEAQP